MRSARPKEDSRVTIMRRIFGAVVALLLLGGPSAAYGVASLTARDAEAEPDPSIKSWVITDGTLNATWAVPPERASDVVRFMSYVWLGDDDSIVTERGPYVREESVDLSHVPDGTRVGYLLEVTWTSGMTTRASAAGTKGDAPELTFEAISHSEDDLLELRWVLPPSEAEVLGYEVELMMSSIPPDQEETSFHETTEPVLLVPFPYGRSFGTFRLRPLTNDGPGTWSKRLSFYYEDVLPAPTRLTVKPRAGGFQVGWRFNAGAGTPSSWLVSLDGEPVQVKVKRYNYGHKALLLGLPSDSEHTVTVQSVGPDGPGLPASLTARTAGGPRQMPAPGVSPGSAGGSLSVMVSWRDPDWGGASPCCFRITAIGRSGSGEKARVQRFADASTRRLDFAVGAVGPWRFVVEAKTGAGFSPLSAASTRVRAR
ncbi:hypothetical protein [Nocardioides sp.]|uniref:hypothetical protein n=1 Tax=Nocardioides sp. TaxID=35761 RepID=UPI00260DFF86|nr:hypothetical protein [Nocardioides sp.]